MARKKRKPIFRYNCSMTDEEFKTTKEATNPSDLISVAAYYELNPENDDRPEAVVKELGIMQQEKDEEKEKLEALSSEEES